MIIIAVQYDVILLTLPSSMQRVSITIAPRRFSHIILQKSLIVSLVGPTIKQCDRNSFRSMYIALTLSGNICILTIVPLNAKSMISLIECIKSYINVAGINVIWARNFIKLFQFHPWRFIYKTNMMIVYNLNTHHPHGRMLQNLFFSWLHGNWPLSRWSDLSGSVFKDCMIGACQPSCTVKCKIIVPQTPAEIHCSHSHASSPHGPESKWDLSVPTCQGLSLIAYRTVWPIKSIAHHYFLCAVCYPALTYLLNSNSLSTCLHFFQAPSTHKSHNVWTWICTSSNFVKDPKDIYSNDIISVWKTNQHTQHQHQQQNSTTRDPAATAPKK